jgi:hypothetical protein
MNKDIAALGSLTIVMGVVLVILINISVATTPLRWLDVKRTIKRFNFACILLCVGNAILLIGLIR